MDLQIDFSIAIGCDHAGFDLKNAVINFLKTKQIQFEDFGTSSEESVDYPDYAIKVARSITSGNHSLGILICGTGLGMSIVANKFRKIRAALCTTPYLAEYSRRHNDANILCLGGRILSVDEAKNIIEVWLRTPFEGGRHASRIQKINHIS